MIGINLMKCRNSHLVVSFSRYATTGIWSVGLVEATQSSLTSLKF
ncbi:hypothetical protein [Helicobacter pullorum]|nr:hypothetical protein [Helicobacter pullorum]